MAELPDSAVDEGELATANQLDDDFRRWRRSLDDDELAAPGACPDDVVVWRGIRNLEATFGVARDSAHSLVDKVRLAAGFLSTTTHRSVAVSEFVGSKRGALLRIRVPAGTKAAWLPAAGDPSLGYQGELLLEEDLYLHINATSEEDGILILDCEVTE